jgi:hypothetical protein
VILHETQTGYHTEVATLIDYKGKFVDFWRKDTSLGFFGDNWRYDYAV